jgi:hypothetical protein
MVVLQKGGQFVKNGRIQPFLITFYHCGTKTAVHLFNFCMIPFGPKQTKNLKISSGYIETSGRPHAACGACV